MDINNNGAKKENTLVQNLIPIILLLVMIGSGVFVYIMFISNTISKITPIQQTGIIVNTDFLNSETFTSLKFIPDQAVFNEVTGPVPSGKTNPFTP